MNPLVWDDDWLDYEQSGNVIRNSTIPSPRDNWGSQKTFLEQMNGEVRNGDIGGTHDYHLDGSGIDYIHPRIYPLDTILEWQDRNGNSLS